MVTQTISMPMKTYMKIHEVQEEKEIASFSKTVHYLVQQGLARLHELKLQYPEDK